MAIAISQEQRALQASIREWARQADTLALVRRLEPGVSPPNSGDLWNAVADLGIFSIALPAAVGGADGTVADLAAALEQLACALVPGPVLPTLLAGLLLRDHADLPTAKELLPDLAAGRASVAVGLTAGTLTAGTLTGGTLTRSVPSAPPTAPGRAIEKIPRSATASQTTSAAAAGRPDAAAGSLGSETPGSRRRTSASGPACCAHSRIDACSARCSCEMAIATGPPPPPRCPVTVMLVRHQELEHVISKGGQGAPRPARPGAA